MDDEEGDDDVLDGEEEVLAVGRERELVAIRVRERDSVGERLEHVGGEGETACGTCADDYGTCQDKRERCGRWWNVLRRS